MFRQGDVLIIPVDSIPEKTTREKMDKRKRYVLAEGEATGHAHAVRGKDAVLVMAADGRRFLSVMNPTQVRHEEHGAIDLAPGHYEVIRQVEYSPSEIRTVED